MLSASGADYKYNIAAPKSRKMSDASLSVKAKVGVKKLSNVFIKSKYVLINSKEFFTLSEHLPSFLPPLLIVARHFRSPRYATAKSKISAKINK